ncbi:MAG: MMPL family transporter [Myxococcales bacterium]|nr:MMPL family transporter [Myxococcales bacterium]MCB9708244.1 MMPL family transporter [Myxococcales bacterium]
MNAGFKAIYLKLLRLQIKHPLRILIVAVLITAGSIPLALELELNSHWRALLPDTTPSVRDLNRIGDNIGGLSTLSVVIQSHDLPAMQRFAHDAVPRLKQALGKDIVRIDWNLKAYKDLVTAHRHLYVPLEELQKIRDDLSSRLEYETLSANPLYVDLGDEAPPPIQTFIKDVKTTVQAQAEVLDEFPEGYYVHPKKDLLVFFIRTDVEGGDAKPSERLMKRSTEVLQKLQPESYAPDMKVSLAGDIPEALEEHRAITEELTLATSLTVILVLVVIFVFFRRWRAVPLLGLGLLPPVALTFAVAELSVDYLNTSTAFLGSIVIGNGVNPYIIWLARYFEERRKGRSRVIALAHTHRNVWSATLTASLAAAAAYGSLILTDFRGFRDFGIISATGMVLCWLGSVVILPALISFTDSLRPITQPNRPARQAPYGRLFATLIYRFPKGIVSVSIGLGILSAALVGVAISRDPLEYNINNLRSVRKGSTRTQLLNDRVNEFMTRTASGTVVILLAPSRAEVNYLQNQLEARRDAGKAVYGPVRSINNLLPSEQRKKINVLNEIRELLARMRPHLSPSEQADIDQFSPPDTLVALTDNDLPSDVVAPFKERNGTVGRLVFVEQSDRRANWDGRYLVAWSRDARAVKTSTGKHPPLAGRPPIFADMLEAIWQDGPRAIGASLVATVMLLFMAFTQWSRRLVTLAALLLGVLWMGGAMAILGIKLNFLNFVAFPITFGNGVDYGVNVMRRYASEASRGTDRLLAIRYAIEETGGAVVLCSLTTVIGYMSLHASSNRAINSFGAAMGISEITCLLTAVVTMPAIMLLWKRRRQVFRVSSPTQP